MCRPCWQEKGRPALDPGSECRRCRKCLRGSEKRNAVYCWRCLEEFSPTEEIREVVRKAEPLGQPCTVKKTWADVFAVQAEQKYAKSESDYHPCHNTVYEMPAFSMGNLPHTAEEKDVLDWIASQKLASDDGSKITYRCRLKGGHIRGEHGVYQKVFKRFAFITPDNVVHADDLRRLTHGVQWGGRTIKSYPAVAGCTWRPNH